MQRQVLILSFIDIYAAYITKINNYHSASVGQLMDHLTPNIGTIYNYKERGLSLTCIDDARGKRFLIKVHSTW